MPVVLELPVLRLFEKPGGYVFSVPAVRCDIRLCLKTALGIHVVAAGVSPADRGDDSSNSGLRDAGRYRVFRHGLARRFMVGIPEATWLPESRRDD